MVDETTAAEGNVAGNVRNVANGSNGNVARIVAVANRKGGCGKTTTAVNLAACLGELGQRVLVLDLDPQAQASRWLGVADGGRGLFDALTGNNGSNGNVADLVRATAVRNVEVIASSTWLAGVERVLAAEPGAERVLAGLLAGLPRDRWDVVLLDCPPALGLLTLNALSAAHEVLVPTEPTTLAVEGLAQLVDTIGRVRERLNPALELGGVVAVRADVRRALTRDVITLLRDRFGDAVLTTTVRDTVRLAEAPSFSQPITTYAPVSAGAEDYRAVAVEWLRRRRPACPAA